MAIQPKPSVDGFIGKAPDAETAETGAPGPRQPKKQITVTLDPALLEEAIDLLLAKYGKAVFKARSTGADASGGGGDAP